MRTIIVPVFNDRISSRLDCTEYFQVVKIDKKEIRSIERIRILSSNQFEKARSLISLKPDAVICNGLTTFYEAEFHKNNIQVLPWIHGEFEDVVEKFIQGNYKQNKVMS